MQGFSLPRVFLAEKPLNAPAGNCQDEHNRAGRGCVFVWSSIVASYGHSSQARLDPLADQKRQHCTAASRAGRGRPRRAGRGTRCVAVGRGARVSGESDYIGRQGGFQRGRSPSWPTVVAQLRLIGYVIRRCLIPHPSPANPLPSVPDIEASTTLGRCLGRYAFHRSAALGPALASLARPSASLI